MIGSSVTRASLERFFPSPFSEYQWRLIVAQGYEEAIASGARTAEDVAEELKGLIEAAGQGTAEDDQSDTVRGGASKLTWEEMEKLVLGRALARREVDGPRLVLGSAGKESRTKRLFANRQRNFRLWWISLASAVGVLIVAVIAWLAFGGLECGSGGERSASTVTSDATLAGAGPQVDTTLPSTTTTSEATETVPELSLPDYTADLVGSEVVPPADTEAVGKLELTLSRDGQTVGFVLSLENIDSLTVARLRTAEPGADGDEILTVYSGPAMEGVFSGVAAEGSFGAADLVGPLKDRTIADFTALVDEGMVYLIVGTAENRGGELRGQLK